MYKIAIYGNSGKVVEFFDSMQKGRNIEVCCVVNPGRTAAIRKSTIPSKIIKDRIEDLVPAAGTLFAVLNADDEPGLPEQLAAAGLEGLRIISGASASFLYETPPVHGAGKMDYRKMVFELKSMANSLSILFDREKLLAEILKGLCDQTNATRASVMLYDRKEKVLKVAMAYGIDRILWDYIRIPVGEGIAGKVAETKKPLLITGSPDDRGYRKLRKREDVKAAICVPLIQGTSVIGVINLSNHENVNAFSEKDLETVQDISPVITDVLSASRNFIEFKEDAQRYKILSEISEIVTERTTLFHKLTKLVGYLKARFGVLSVIAIKGSDESFETVATNFPLWEHADIFGEPTIERHVFETRAEVCLVDPESAGLKGYLSMPLVDGELCFGVISFLSFQSESPEKKEFFRELAGRLSMLISLSYQKEGIAEQNRRADLAARILKELTQTPDAASFGKHILHALARELDARIGVLRVYDDERQSYLVKEVVGIEEIMRKEFFQIDRAIVKAVLKNGESLLVKSTARDRAYAHVTPNIQNILVCPMKGGERPAMVFSFYNSEGKAVGRGFSEFDISFIGRFFERAAAVLEDITQKTGITDDSLLDAVTGLPNFRYFEKRVFDEVMRARRHGRRVVILVGELHPYEAFLKSYGKKATDEFARKVALQLRDRIRSFEVVARLNTNKFGIVLVDADEKALEVIFRLKKLFEAENWDPKKLIPEGVRLRFGYSRFPDDGEEYDELIVKANHIRG